MQEEMQPPPRGDVRPLPPPLQSILLSIAGRVVLAGVVLRLVSSDATTQCDHPGFRGEQGKGNARIPMTIPPKGSGN